MKKDLYIYLLPLVLSLLLSASCSIDNVEPNNKLTDKNVIQDLESAQHVLNGIYSQWKQYELGLLPMHLAAVGNEGRFTGSVPGSSGMNTNEVNPENDFLATIYNASYSIINEINILVEKLEGDVVGISTADGEQMMAQARCLRAMAYFSLLRNFGQFYDSGSPYGVVVRTDFAYDLEAAPRNSVSEVYAVITEDLQYAMEKGPTGVAHYYAGSLAAKAVMAKVKLYNNAYDEAAALALEVINNTDGYTLEPEFKDVFEKTYTSDEVIFAPYTIVGSEGVISMDQINRTTYSEILEALADGQVSGSGDLNGDGSGYDPRFLYAYSENSKGINQQGKYPYNRNAAGGPGNTNYHLRMAEIYLIYAEAVVRSGGDTDLALWALNEVRGRAHVSLKNYTSDAQLLNDIREEKLLELFYENGEGWYDLIRYHMHGDISAFDEKQTLNSTDQFIFPIPLQAIIGNNRLDPNPGY